MEHMLAWDQEVSKSLQCLNWMLLGYFVIGVGANALLYVQDFPNKRLKFFMKVFAFLDLCVCLSVPVHSYWRNNCPLTSQGELQCGMGFFGTRTLCTLPGLLIILALTQHLLNYLYPNNNPLSMGTVRKLFTGFFIYSFILHLPMPLIYGDVVIENWDDANFNSNGTRCGLKHKELSERQRYIKDLYLTIMVNSALCSLVILLGLLILTSLLLATGKMRSIPRGDKREIKLYCYMGVITLVTYAASLASNIAANTDATEFWSKQWTNNGRKLIVFFNDFFLLGHVVKPFLYKMMIPDISKDKLKEQ